MKFHLIFFFNKQYFFCYEKKFIHPPKKWNHNVQIVQYFERYKIDDVFHSQLHYSLFSSFMSSLIIFLRATLGIQAYTYQLAYIHTFFISYFEKGGLFKCDLNRLIHFNPRFMWANL